MRKRFIANALPLSSKRLVLHLHCVWPLRLPLLDEPAATEGSVKYGSLALELAGVARSHAGPGAALLPVAMRQLAALQANSRADLCGAPDTVS